MHPGEERFRLLMLTVDTGGRPTGWSRHLKFCLEAVLLLQLTSERKDILLLAGVEYVNGMSHLHEIPGTRFGRGSVVIAHEDDGQVTYLRLDDDLRDMSGNGRVDVPVAREIHLTRRCLRSAAHPEPDDRQRDRPPAHKPVHFSDFRKTSTTGISTSGFTTGSSNVQRRSDLSSPLSMRFQYGSATRTSLPSCRNCA